MRKLEDLTKQELIERVRAQEARIRSLTEDGLTHELEVHREELEMQELELKDTRDALEASRARYADLFDFAPVGYFVLDGNGLILAANLTGAALLGHDRERLVQTPFRLYVHPDDRSDFFRSLWRAFRDPGKDSIELRLTTGTGRTLHALLEGVALATAAGGKTCRVAVLDISERHAAEERARELLTENRRLTHRLFAAREEEDLSLARELHDEMGQWLTAIRADAQALLGLIDEMDRRAYASASAIAESAAQAQAVVRRIMQRLRPGVLVERCLAEGLREQVEEWQRHHPAITCDLRMDEGMKGINSDLGITVYRIVQECLTNVSRHAQPSRVQVCLTRERDDHGAGWLALTVSDDGRGVDPRHHRNGYGLIGIRERAFAAGGEMAVDTRPGGGFRVSVRLPLKPPEE